MTTVTGTLRYKVWRALHTCPRSPVAMAEMMGADPGQIRDVFRRLRDSGHITFSHREGREAVYKISGVALPTRGKPRGPKGQVKGESASRVVSRISDGYGAGTIELERCWVGVTHD